ncbi:hypothetical protein PQX77_005386 [Marasmius sp. AFHP31]|nr:hypothetical protein PQX77_005386 [Marasmius sp. AFHP31]
MSFSKTSMKHQRNDSNASLDNKRAERTSEKRMRSGDGQMPTNEIPHGQAIRTAYDLQRAISCIKKYEHRLGSVVCMWDLFRCSSLSQAKREVLDQLESANNQANRVTRSFFYGTYDWKIHLRVTHPGCEYESKDIGWKTHIPKPVFDQWLENAPVSGFGDNRALETKVDNAVRKACEIPASGFEVTRELLGDVAKTWTNNFLPSKVRAEPYKIHIYGEGGHFESYRDTPESLLVGTFLLGIGDHTPDPRSTFSDNSPLNEETEFGNFCIEGIRRRADPGSWVAFHPDIPHSVEPLESGCRGAVAFKIFSLEDDGGRKEASGRYPAAVETTKAALEDIKGSFGVVLQHDYPMGTDSYNLVGSDAVLLAAATQLPEVKVVEVIPILVDLDEKYINDPNERTIVKTNVYPLTRFHVDTVLNRKVDPEVKAGMEWIKDAKDLPFYGWDFKSKAMKLSSNHETINWVGNESDGTRDTSLYVAYAIVVLSNLEAGDTGEDAAEDDFENDSQYDSEDYTDNSY